jgi:hypothetical protein
VSDRGAGFLVKVGRLRADEASGEQRTLTDVAQEGLKKGREGAKS